MEGRCLANKMSHLRPIDKLDPRSHFVRHLYIVINSRGETIASPYRAIDPGAKRAFKARICSGPVPQQPPTMRTPWSLTHPSATAA